MMNKAYLNVTSAGAKPVIFIDDDATAADAVEAAQENVVSVKKFFKNGQLLIETANGLVNAAADRKLMQALKEVVTLDKKAISFDEFVKL